MARELTVESDLPSDFPSEGPLSFRGNPARDRSSSDTPRLQENDRATADERGRNSCGLAGARRGCQDSGAVTRQRVANVVDVGVNG
jgi:hypothetical protein